MEPGLVMGPWNSIKGRLYEAHGDTHEIHRVSRFESGSPACGSGAVRVLEAQAAGKPAVGWSRAAQSLGVKEGERLEGTRPC